MLALGILAIGWVIITAMMARDQLEHVRAGLTHFQGEITDADISSLRAEAQSIAKSSRSAHSLTSGPAWAVTAHIPGLGGPLKSIRGISKEADALASHAVPQLLTLTQKLDPKNLRAGNGAIDVAAVASARPVLNSVVNETGSATRSIKSLPAHTWLSQVDKARSQLITSLGNLGGSLDKLNRSAGLLVPMLGSQSPQTYFIGFVNEAEMRGSGGLPGSFAIAHVENGKLNLTHFGADTELSGVTSNVSLGTEFADLYTSDPLQDFRDSNVSPNFPYAARIWADMWQKKSGQQVTGAIMIDPTALGYLLKVTGPAKLPDGGELTSANVVSLTQQTLYAKFPVDETARKLYLIDIAQAAADRLLGGGGDTTALVKAALQGAAQRRIAVWSADPALETQLEQTTVSGAVPVTTAPFTGVVVNNGGGNKLDYYLHRSLTWTATGCGSTRTTEAVVTLANEAPASGLPAYVTTRLDNPGYPTKPGDNKLIVYYYATRGARLTGASLDGKTVTLELLSELGHPVYVATVELPRGTTRTLKFYTTEPNNGAPATVLQQPGVVPEQVTATAESCKR